MKKSDILLLGLQVYSQLKVMHWQANKHSMHKLLQELYEQFDELNDSLIETLFSLNQSKIGVGNGIITVKNFDIESPITTYLLQLTTIYNNIRQQFVSDNQIITIIDEIIIVLRKYIYLFKMMS